MFKSFRNRMLRLNMIIITIIMISAFTIIYAITYSYTFASEYQKLDRVNLAALPFVRNPNEQIDDKYKSDNQNSFSLFLDEEMKVEKISSFLDVEDDEYITLVDKINNRESNTGLIEFNDVTWLYEISQFPDMEIIDAYLDESVYKISLIDVTNSVSVMNTLLYILVSVAIIMLVVIYFVSMYFANKSIKPLELMWLKQKRFVADATHELKTPLTIIGANSDLLLMNTDSKIKDQLKWIEYIKSETKSMNILINELLLSAKAEEEKYNLKKEDISKIIKETIMSFEAIMFEKNIKLKTNVDDNIILNTDYQKFKQLLVIFLDNAIKYNKDKGIININLYREKKKVILEVTNSGKGIEKEDLPHIFERFYKSDKARTNNSSNSYGLGLYIAKTIVQNLKGTISAKSELNKNTTFKIIFKI